MVLITAHMDLWLKQWPPRQLVTGNLDDRCVVESVRIWPAWLSEPGNKMVKFPLLETGDVRKNTLDGRNPVLVGMYKNPVNNGIKVSTSTGAGFLPSTLCRYRNQQPFGRMILPRFQV